MHAIHLNISRVAFLMSLGALLATVAVLALAPRLGDVSLGGSSGGAGSPAPAGATGLVSSGAPHSAFFGSPFATPFRVSLPWTTPVR